MIDRTVFRRDDVLSRKSESWKFSSFSAELIVFKKRFTLLLSSYGSWLSLKAAILAAFSALFNNSVSLLAGAVSFASLYFDPRIVRVSLFDSNSAVLVEGDLPCKGE